MKLAIVVPCYNQVETTKKSLESLFRETDNDYSVLLIDDCSTDGTKEYGQLLEKTHSQVRYIRNAQNYGVNRSWNIGIKAAKALNPEYIFIVNNDLLYTRDWEKPMIQALENPKVGVVSPLSTCGPIPRDWPMGARRAPNPAGYMGYLTILGACFGSRASLYDDIGYFPEQLRIYYGDNWIALAAQAKGYKCGYVNSYIHHLMCQSTSKLNNSAIWPVEQPIFRQIGKKYGEDDACSVNNNFFKPFVPKGTPWQTRMNTWYKD